MAFYARRYDVKGIEFNCMEVFAVSITVTNGCKTGPSTPPA